MSSGSIVFVLWQKVRSTTKVPTVHLPFMSPNPPVRADHQHQPFVLSRIMFLAFVCVEKEPKGCPNCHIDHLLECFEDDVIVQQVVVEAGRRRAYHNILPLHNVQDVNF